MVCCVSQVHNQQEPSAKILAYYFIILVLEESLHSSSASEMFLDIQNSFTKLRCHKPHSTFKYIFHIVQLLFLGQIWDATWLNLRPPSYYHYANKLVPLVHRQRQVIDSCQNHRLFVDVLMPDTEQQRPQSTREGQFNFMETFDTQWRHGRLFITVINVYKYCTCTLSSRHQLHCNLYTHSLNILILNVKRIIYVFRQ